MGFTASVVQRPDNSPSTVKKCYIWSSTVKKFQGVSNLTISANLDGIPAPKEFLNSKNQFSCQKNILSRQYNTLQPACIWKCFEILQVKGQENLQNTSVKINSYRSWYLRQFLDPISN